MADVPPSTPAAVRGAALTLLGRRDYTSAELRQRLRDKGHDVVLIDAVIADLTTDGTINDRRVATSHVRVANQIKGRGRHRIRQELVARGLSRHEADDAVAALDPADEAAAIARFLSRKRGADPLPIDARRRLFQQLLRKGFAAEAIAKALRYDPDAE